MKLSSNNIPQADSLDEVVRTVEAVAAGHTSFQTIADYLGKVERQGRYYRLAAILLGLLYNDNNTAQLTREGHELLAAPTNESRRLILLQRMLQMPIFQRLIPFLENHEWFDRAQFQDFLTTTTDTTANMVDRRTSTILAWLRAVELIEAHDPLYRFNPSAITTLPPLEFTDISEPLLPRNPELKAYEITHQRATQDKKSIQVFRNMAKVERANRHHQHLVDLVSVRLKSIGAIPRFNQFIDLAASVNNIPYIFEMKSLHRSNARAQLRKGLSQLYEYRYLQNLAEARLVLVVERSLPDAIQWMQHYLEQDRHIYLVWDGDNQLYASSETNEALAFLW